MTIHSPLTDSMQRWWSPADSMPQFICLLDREGRVLRANRTLERWKLGIDIEDVGGLYLHDVLHRDCDNSGCSTCSTGRMWTRCLASMAPRTLLDPGLSTIRMASPT